MCILPSFRFTFAHHFLFFPFSPFFSVPAFLSCLLVLFSYSHFFTIFLFSFPIKSMFFPFFLFHHFHVVAPSFPTLFSYSSPIFPIFLLTLISPFWFFLFSSSFTSSSFTFFFFFAQSHLTVFFSFYFLSIFSYLFLYFPLSICTLQFAPFFRISSPLTFFLYPSFFSCSPVNLFYISSLLAYWQFTTSYFVNHSRVLNYVPSFSFFLACFPPFFSPLTLSSVSYILSLYTTPPPSSLLFPSFFIYLRLSCFSPPYVCLYSFVLPCLSCFPSLLLYFFFYSFNSSSLAVFFSFLLFRMQTRFPI